MDKKLQLIRHLYDEADDRSELNRLLNDPELKSEYQAMSEAKFWLDHSKREKPSAEVLHHIVEAAGNSGADMSTPSMHAMTRQDRDAIPRRQSARKRRFLGSASLIVATLVTAFIGYQLYTNGTLLPVSNDQEQSVQGEASTLAGNNQPAPASIPDEKAAQDLVEERESDAVPSESRQRVTSTTADPGLQAASVSQADTVLPDWDKRDDLIRYKQRIDMLLRQNEDLAWDQAVVPLETLPANRPADRQVQQAGSRRSGNGNQ